MPGGTLRSFEWQKKKQVVGVFLMWTFAIKNRGFFNKPRKE